MAKLLERGARWFRAKLPDAAALTVERPCARTVAFDNGPFVVASLTVPLIPGM